jgi:hypothetical protein
MNHINTLQYADAPDYRKITLWLLEIYNNYEMIQRINTGNNMTWELSKRKVPIR